MLLSTSVTVDLSSIHQHQCCQLVSLATGVRPNAQVSMKTLCMATSMYPKNVYKLCSAPIACRGTQKWQLFADSPNCAAILPVDCHCLGSVLAPLISRTVSEECRGSVAYNRGSSPLTSLDRRTHRSRPRYTS